MAGTLLPLCAPFDCAPSPSPHPFHLDARLFFTCPPSGPDRRATFWPPYFQSARRFPSRSSRFCMYAGNARFGRARVCLPSEWRAQALLMYTKSLRPARQRAWPRVSVNRRRCAWTKRDGVSLPRVNECAAVAGWLVKTVALFTYPFLRHHPPSATLLARYSRLEFTLRRRAPPARPRATFHPHPRVSLLFHGSLLFLTFPIFHSWQYRA